MQSYLAYIRTTLRLTLRDRLILFFNYIFPLIFFFAFGEGIRGGGGAGGAAQLIAMVLILSVLGTGFFGGGMRAVAERENNILRRFKVAPISPGPILVSSIVVGWLTWLPSILLFLFLAQWRYGLELPEHFTELLVFLTIGVVAFRALGLIIASVVNSMAESQVIIQLLYLPMLLLSGATFPLSILPNWLQVLAQFIPSTHLYLGMQGILMRNESLWQNIIPTAALVLTAAVSIFISMKLFRWEKEEKTKPAAKLWLLAVMAPFLLIGGWEAHTKDNLKRTQELARAMSRSRNRLIHDARVFLGDGRVIERASVFVRNGRIEEVYEGSSPDASSLRAGVIEAAGKTLLPGLVDTSINLALSGGVDGGGGLSLDLAGLEHAMAAYLYCGVTAVRDSGAPLQLTGPLKMELESGEKLGADLFFSNQGQPGGVPSLVAAEALELLGQGKSSPLERPLVQQVGPRSLLESTVKRLAAFRAQPPAGMLDKAKAELLKAAASGAPLVIATRSGSPMLIHGPAIHREMQLWVEAGIPPKTVLMAATANGAALLGASQRWGLVKKGMAANLLLVDGNPLQDISNTERIVAVIYRGELVGRDELFENKK